MHRTLTAALFLGTALILAATAGARADTTLSERAAAFVADERSSADAARQQAITDCLVSAFDGLAAGEITTMLAEEDFEDAIDVLLKAYPEREEIIEVCEDL